MQGRSGAPLPTPTRRGPQDILSAPTQRARHSTAARVTLWPPHLCPLQEPRGAPPCPLSCQVNGPGLASLPRVGANRPAGLTAAHTRDTSSQSESEGHPGPLPLPGRALAARPTLGFRSELFVREMFLVCPFQVQP